MPTGYSGTPLVKRLGFRPGMRVVFVGDPARYARELGPLPEGTPLLSRVGADMDLIHVFCTRRAELERRFASLEPRLARDGMPWVSWPKKTSSLASELTGDLVRATGLAAGLVDEDWSGLEFVRRVRDRR